MQVVHSKKITKLIDTLNTRTKWNNTMLLELIANLEINEEDIRQYQSYNHNVECSYGRNELYTNEYFRIYLMSWDAGDATAIHDHGSTDWGCVQFFGETEHRLYSLEDEILKLKEKEKICSGSIVPVSGQLIHLMANTGTDSVCTLHIYGSNCPRQEDETALVFQPEKGQTVTTLGTAYLNMQESEIISRSELPKMFQADYQDYLQLITPFYKRIGQKIVLD